MWKPESNTFKIVLIAGLTGLTIGVHYGWLVEPFFGHVHWIHSIHGRFCYIPIVIAASWFGLRGGLVTAGAITVLILPFVLRSLGDTSDFIGEMADIVFYFAIAVLIGVLVDREFKARRREQEAQLQVERAHQLSLVGQIAAGVAHEIKNPLASIKGATDILTDEATGPAEREEFKEILRNEVRRIDTTVGEFLEFARPKETKLETVDLTATVRSSLRQTEADAKRQGLAIESELDGEITVSGDREKLHQLTLNLVLNAIQATRAGDTISVRLDRAGRNGGARLTIADTGSGIATDDLEHVFEPFFTTKSSGTGLGLAVVKAIVGDHKGEISITSEKGRGTTVVITLPTHEDGSGR